MKILTLFIFILTALAAPAQFNLKHLGKKSLPGKISYEGNLIQAVRWRDSTGDNIVLLTTLKASSKNAPDDGYSDGKLYAYHYMVSGDSVKQTWKIYDFVKECPVDMFLYFVDKAVAITDLNRDGRAEIWIMYKVSCQGDVSPIPMKIIMYEGSKKFAIRGTTRVMVSASKYMGGEFVLDEAFKNGPPEFRKYAEQLWAKHKTETWEQ